MGDGLRAEHDPFPFDRMPFRSNSRRYASARSNNNYLMIFL